MRSRRQLEVCVYCTLNPGDTRDHIPPKSFFPSPLPSDLITVPCCLACNSKFAKDEEYVRAILSSTWNHEGENSPAFKVWDSKVKRSALRSTPFLLRIVAGLKMVDVYSPGGVYLGRRPAFELDRPRFERVMTKIARGLHYYETGVTLPPEVSSGIVFNPDPERWTDLIDALGPVKGRHPEVFRYRCAFTPDRKRGSVWLFQFYEKPTFLVLTLDRRQIQISSTPP